MALPKLSRTTWNILLGLVVVAFIVIFSLAIGLVFGEHDIQPGALVQMTFTGSPAYLMTALLGPKGELAGSLTLQDAINTMYCDVPGSAGAYSSWYRNAGANALASSFTGSAFWNRDSASCTQDSDCVHKPWLQCGRVGNCWLGGTFTGSDWGPEEYESCCGNAEPGGVLTNKSLMQCTFDAGSEASQNSGHCVMTSNTNDPDGNLPFRCDTGIPGGRCVPLGWTPGAPVVCAQNSDCGAGQACNLAKNGGVCEDDTGEFAVLNVDWLAEGVVKSMNSDGTANVEWRRIRCLYPFKGPVLKWMDGALQSHFNTRDWNWDYTQCVFIAGSDALNSVSADNTCNTNATAFALGHVDSTGSLSEVAGLPTMNTGQNYFEPPVNVWNQSFTVQAGAPQYGWNGSGNASQTSGVGAGLMSIRDNGATSETSAWNLIATNVPRHQLTRVSKFRIENTDPQGTSGFNHAFLASMTSFRCEYAQDRPPHLQCVPPLTSCTLPLGY